MLRKSGDINEFLEKLNFYIELNPMDGEAWLELCDVYLEYFKYNWIIIIKLSYNKAVFCMEELILLYPKKLFYMMRAAEVNFNIFNLIRYITQLVVLITYWMLEIIIVMF